MKIGFFTDTYFPSSFGVERSIETFRENLQKLGHEVYIFAPYYLGYKDKDPKVFRFFSLPLVSGGPRFVFPFLPIGRLREILALKLDICHAHTPFGLGFLGKFFSFFGRVPFVYTNHIHYVEYARMSWTKVFPSKLVERYIGFLGNLAAGVIAPSLKVKRLLESYGVKRPIFVLPTGIDLGIFKQTAGAKSSLRKKINLEPETNILIYVGRISKEKNVEFLIKTMAEIKKMASKQVVLLLVGTGPYLAGIEKLTKDLDLENSVKFAGFVPHNQIPPFYRGSDIFVFASLTDTQGIVILEAMASGLPVVALKDDAFAGMVVNNQNGYLIENPLPELFARKVIGILENQKLCRGFSENSIKIAANFSEENQTKKLLEIYQKIRPFAK